MSIHSILGARSDLNRDEILEAINQASYLVVNENWLVMTVPTEHGDYMIGIAKNVVWPVSMIKTGLKVVRERKRRLFTDVDASLKGDSEAVAEFLIKTGAKRHQNFLVWEK